MFSCSMVVLAVLYCFGHAILDVLNMVSTCFLVVSFFMCFFYLLLRFCCSMVGKRMSFLVAWVGRKARFDSVYATNNDQLRGPSWAASHFAGK